MSTVLWFFFLFGLHSTQLVGPFDSQGACESVRVDSDKAAKEQMSWLAPYGTRPCFEASK